MRTGERGAKYARQITAYPNSCLSANEELRDSAGFLATYYHGNESYSTRYLGDVRVRGVDGVEYTVMPKVKNKTKSTMATPQPKRKTAMDDLLESMDELAVSAAKRINDRGSARSA